MTGLFYVIYFPVLVNRIDRDFRLLLFDCTNQVIIMKKLFILSILLVATLRIIAEETMCIRFKLEITIDNNEKFVGEYIYFGMYCDFADTSSFDEVLRRINHNQQTSSARPRLLFYKNVKELPYRICESSDLLYCMNEDVIELSLDQIKSYRVIDKVACHPETGYNKFPGGCPPEIITELNKEDIERLNSQPKLEIHTLDFEDYFGGFTFTHILSYGSLDSTNIIKTIDNYLSAIQTSEDEQFEISETQYEALKGILREKKIIMVRTYYYN